MAWWHTFNSQRKSSGKATFSPRIDKRCDHLDTGRG